MADALSALLHALIPAEVWRAERRIARGKVSESSLRVLLTFHQDTVGPIARAFAFALPSEAALRAIAAYAPRGVVEVGAGSGLWAALLRHRGVVCHAYDADEPAAVFGGVRRGQSSAAALHPECGALLLCWPPLEAGVDGPNLMALRALRAFEASLDRGRAADPPTDPPADGVLLYVGEWPGTCGSLSALSESTAACGHTAGTQFVRAVLEGWRHARTVPLAHWPGFNDKLHVFIRRAPSCTLAPHGAEALGSDEAAEATREGDADGVDAPTAPHEIVRRVLGSLDAERVPAQPLLVAAVAVASQATVQYLTSVDLSVTVSTRVVVPA